MRFSFAGEQCWISVALCATPKPIVFDGAPNARHMIARGPVDLGDGILAARNPRV
jgi:hypothetical protein